MSDFRKIINAAGGQTAVAKACGVTVPAVNKWVKAGELPGKDYFATVQRYRKLIGEMANVEPDSIP